MRPDLFPFVPLPQGGQRSGTATLERLEDSWLNVNDPKTKSASSPLLSIAGERERERDSLALLIWVVTIQSVRRSHAWITEETPRPLHVVGIFRWLSRPALGYSVCCVLSVDFKAARNRKNKIPRLFASKRKKSDRFVSSAQYFREEFTTETVFPIFLFWSCSLFSRINTPVSSRYRIRKTNQPLPPSKFWDPMKKKKNQKIF